MGCDVFAWNQKERLKLNVMYVTEKVGVLRDALKESSRKRWAVTTCRNV
jgi:hypothetical protein